MELRRKEEKKKRRRKLPSEPGGVQGNWRLEPTRVDRLNINPVSSPSSSAGAEQTNAINATIRNNWIENEKWKRCALQCRTMRLGPDDAAHQQMGDARLRHAPQLLLLLLLRCVLFTTQIIQIEIERLIFAYGRRTVGNGRWAVGGGGDIKKKKKQ